MKASVLNQINGVLSLQDVPTPLPQPSEVLIKVETIGVNFAENQMRLGIYPLQLTPPVILGAEVAGTVIRTGDTVNNVWKDKRVIAALNAANIFTGAYAEYVVAPIDTVVEIPDQVSFAQAVAIPVQGLTAYFMLHRAAQIKSTDSLFVHAAAGGVGSIVIQLAKLMGVRTVIAGAGTKDKLELARSFGADILINYSESNWPDQLMTATNGKGADIILSSGSEEMTKKSLKVLAPGGRFLVYGALDVTKLSFDTDQMLQVIFNNQSITGFVTAPFIADPKELRIASKYLLHLISSGALKIVLANQYHLEEAQQALEDLANRKTIGKVTLTTGNK